MNAVDKPCAYCEYVPVDDDDYNEHLIIEHPDECDLGESITSSYFCGNCQSKFPNINCMRCRENFDYSDGEE